MLKNPMQHFGHMYVIIILLEKRFIAFIRFSKKRLGITGNRIKSKLPKMKYKIFF